MKGQIQDFYRACAYNHPNIIKIFVLGLTLILAMYIPKFQFDASAETLLLKNDPDLEYYRSIKARYGSDDFLIITFSPKQKLFSEDTLKILSHFKNDLQKIPNVGYIISILDVPLVKSPPVPLGELKKQIRSIENQNVKLNLAYEELTSSSYYENLLISSNGETTALLVGLQHYSGVENLLKQRNVLQDKQLSTELDTSEKVTLTKIEEQIKNNKAEAIKQQQKCIDEIREVISKYQKYSKIYMGGVPMITADSIRYIKHDILTFGLIVTCLILLILICIFRELRWTVFPLLACLIVGLCLMGFMGLVGWPVTVVSSNFLPILLIITLSLAIHLTVRFREAEQTLNKATQTTLLDITIKDKFVPCLYTVITTIIAFGSLFASDIKPLIDFGLIMGIGIIMSFCLTFLLFPVMLNTQSKTQHNTHSNIHTQNLTKVIVKINQNYAKTLLLFFMVFFVLSCIGITFLSVDNRFIDYYKKSTAIYKGMEVIDRSLGGTTPLDIIIDAPKSFLDAKSERLKNASASDNSDLADDDWYFDIEESAGIAFESYWLNTSNLGKVKKIHRYIESFQETGKVLSIASTMNMLEPLDERITQDDIILSVVYAGMSKDLKKTLFRPYVSEDGNQIRFSVRIFESDYNLKRADLLEKLKAGLKETFELNEEQIRFTGMLVLYNNLLQSFFQSQIQTLGIVFLCIFALFWILFKNIKLAIIAIIPNIFSGFFVLGLMGWLNINLDLMTISIAAICVGIAVDNTIHYIHRFKSEYVEQRNYLLAMHNTHTSVGLAMIYTALVITLGFAVLVFSNFVPTVYFGLLTGSSMIIALVADLTLLPILLTQLKPFGTDTLSK